MRFVTLFCVWGVLLFVLLLWLVVVVSVMVLVLVVVLVASITNVLLCASAHRGSSRP